MNNMSTSALVRATIFVRDLTKASQFYHALGFNQCYYQGVLDHPSACQVLGFGECYPYPVKILKVDDIGRYNIVRVALNGHQINVVANDLSGMTDDRASLRIDPTHANIYVNDHLFEGASQ